jgi:tryptophan synthase alpha chain
VSRSLAEVFANARTEGRAAVIGYLPAGYPDKDRSVELINVMVEAGVDIVEVGLPYSDPLMDGADIQAAVEIALAGGTTPDTVLDTVAQVTSAGATAVVMSYWNPIERYGVERFADRLLESGGHGVITPDLTPEEAGPWIQATNRTDMNRIFLVAPSSTDERIRTVVAQTSGFLYAASTMGVTGSTIQVTSAAPELVARSRAFTDLPIAVGLGVSTGEQAREIAGYADGVIVGAALVRCTLRASSYPDAIARTRDLAAELREGVRGTRPAVDSSTGVTT